MKLRKFPIFGEKPKTVILIGGKIGAKFHHWKDVRLIATYQGFSFFLVIILIFFLFFFWF